MSLRERIGLGIFVSLLSGPLSCGGAIGMMLGEKSMPGEGIGQEPWQAPVGLAFAVAGLFGFLLAGSLLKALWRPYLRVVTLVRAAGLYPLGAGIAMLVAGFLRIQEGLVAEGILVSAFAFALLLLGGALILTPYSSDPS